ncbi:hypothetical protein SDC9_131294 [bioreactor metagenome]|uniref:Uncharacterized protein n=1 Tax=bioreactor metagenome TaxID=1076179 RepID=A0A645D5I3_9ZZZZ
MFPRSSDYLGQAYLRGCLLFMAACGAFWWVVYHTVSPIAPARLMNPGLFLAGAALLSVWAGHYFFQWLEKRIWGVQHKPAPKKRARLPVSLLLSVLFALGQGLLMDHLTMLILHIRGEYGPDHLVDVATYLLARREAEGIFLLLLILLLILATVKDILQICRLHRPAEDPWEQKSKTHGGISS